MLPLDAQRFNSILLDMQSSGLRIWDKDFNRYLHSQKVIIYDPVQDYLYDLKQEWDGIDHIGRPAACCLRSSNRNSSTIWMWRRRKPHS